MKKNKACLSVKQGFAPIAIVLIVVAVLAVGGVAYYAEKSFKKENNFINQPIGNDFTYSLYDQDFLAQNMQDIPVGTSVDSIIKTNIELFMRHVCSGSSDNLAVSSNKVYGYNDKYIYAWIYCAEFSTNLQLEGASSVPYRLEYKNPNYLIIGYKRSPDGEGNETINKQIFGKYYNLMIKNPPSNSEIKELENQALDKAVETFKGF